MARAPKSPRSLRQKIALGILIIIAVPVLGFGLLVASLAWQTHGAKQRVAQLCAEFPAGSAYAGFRARARELELEHGGLRRFVADDGVSEVEDSARDGFFTTVWSCRARVRDGEIVESQVEHID